MEQSTKSPDPMDIALGAAVRIRRRTIGMSQEALAEQCGVSFQQIQKYENGANRISFSRLVQIARALGCRVTDLMGALDGPEGHDDRPGQILTPNTRELLDAYDAMSTEGRQALLGLLRAMKPAHDAIPLRGSEPQPSAGGRDSTLGESLVDRRPRARAHPVGFT